MLDQPSSSICQSCGSTLPEKGCSCAFCQKKDHQYKAVATDTSYLWITIATLTFPFWGLALMAWAHKTMGIPSGLQNLVVMLAIFSPLPIVLSNSLGTLAKVVLVFGYYWLAVPVAMFTMFAFGN